MITIKSHIDEILKKEPFVLENIKNGLINISALARQIEPELSKKVGKKLNVNAIIMSIKRMEIEEIKKSRPLKKQLKKIGDLTVKSGLIDYSFQNTPEFEKMSSKFSMKQLTNTNGFHTLCKGVHETTVIISENLKNIFEKSLGDIPYQSRQENLASITIQLPKLNTEVSGLYHYLLGIITWRGISIIEVISTTHELTIILKEEHVSAALEALMKIKEK
jgi:hypothetical protein